MLDFQRFAGRGAWVARHKTQELSDWQAPSAAGRTPTAPSPTPAAESPRIPARSEFMRLLAEVEKLAAELAAARAKVAELEATADVDPLTFVFNRRGFERELKRSLSYVNRYGASAALVYLDLDGFKPVNDAYGHSAGDAVLKAVAAALLRCVRASDTVARLGGDEFAVILWNVTAPVAAAKAAALEADIAGASVRFGDAVLAVGASAGITLLEPNDTPVGVLARADAAMYARKAERGRGR
jgi:diguanylate cyclase (GGDEF)-like protein